MEKWVKIDTVKRSLSLVDIEEFLKFHLIGQNHAIGHITDSFAKIFSKLSADADHPKPLGVFLFLGQTGVGKTYLAKLLAKILNGNMGNLTKINGSEYQESHSISKLIGSPPGYVGYCDPKEKNSTPPILSQKNLKQNCGDGIINPEMQRELDKLEKKSAKRWNPLKNKRLSSSWK